MTQVLKKEPFLSNKTNMREHIKEMEFVCTDFNNNIEPDRKMEREEKERGVKNKERGVQERREERKRGRGNVE